MSTSTELLVECGRIAFNDDGIEINLTRKLLMLARVKIRIPWKSVSFVCPTPYVMRSDNDWATYRGEKLTADAISKGLSFYSFEIALIDRNTILEGKSRYMKAWIKHTLYLSAFEKLDFPPFNNIDYQKRGYINLYLKEKWVRNNGDKILIALDLIERHSRFDLICFEYQSNYLIGNRLKVCGRLSQSIIRRCLGWEVISPIPGHNAGNF
ncbi:hypothetical protein QN374_08245 [Herbaspirillum sp. RTI4]|uniref:hypothetical protein n=1 Tax=Herbaspirillum sp. RTI4 TaxID=3048640 RepID=UPI002B238398|nr:hypothetical protein [Herbaspirillum sp. RTI4]MEA9981829.1 hypothetical protein [Herbaspirillum sp. RTI4]